MNLEEKNGVQFLTFDHLKKAGIKHGYSTKHGGISTGPYATMNLNFGRGDLEENVLENYNIIGKALEMDSRRMCLSKQTHTTNVRVVTEADAGNGILRPRPYDDVDGLMTNVPNLPLVTHFADCVPLFFYDPVHQAIALSHSGWRGTVGKIGKVTIEKMQEVYGTNPADLLCGIGPSICKDCYEVSLEVAEAFRAAFSEEVCREILAPSNKRPEDETHFQLDLWKACKAAMMEAGVPEKQIEVTEYCTHCHPELFFSHRALGEVRGGQAAFLSL